MLNRYAPEKIMPGRPQAGGPLRWAALAFHPAAGPLAVLSCALLALAFKLVLSYHVYGSQDVTSWITYADTIREYGTFKIYSLLEPYNHPPLISLILKITHIISLKTHLAFPFVFRMIPILSDLASIFIIWKLLEDRPARIRVPLCMICCLNPVNFLVSGFHGNTDPLFIMLVLLAVHFTRKGSIFFAGLSYGASLCVKIVPVLLFPLFIFYINREKDKWLFMAVAMALPAAVFLPYLIHDFEHVRHNIFAYNSIPFIWGLQRIATMITFNTDLDPALRLLAVKAFYFHIAYGRWFLLGIIVLFSKMFMSKQRLSLTAGVFFVFCLFLIITQGFGVQYLSWLSYFAVMITPWTGTLFVLAGGYLLYRVYFCLNSSASPYGVAPDLLNPSSNPEQALSLWIWFLVILSLIEFAYNNRALLVGKDRA